MIFALSFKTGFWSMAKKQYKFKVDTQLIDTYKKLLGHCWELPSMNQDKL